MPRGEAEEEEEASSRLSAAAGIAGGGRGRWRHPRRRRGQGDGAGDENCFTVVRARKKKISSLDLPNPRLPRSPPKRKKIELTLGLVMHIFCISFWKQKAGMGGVKIQFRKLEKIRVFFQPL